LLHLLQSFVFQKGIASAAERIELDPTQQLDTRTVAGAKIQFTSDPVLHTDVFFPKIAGSLLNMQRLLEWVFSEPG